MEKVNFICKNTSPAKPRREGIDTFRGFLVVNMVLYHTLWDLCYLFGHTMPWFESIGAFIWEQIVCSAFIFLSGYCWSLGHHQVRRALTVFGGGLAVTAVTFVFMPDAFIFFGVLSFFGCAMLLLCLLAPLLRRIDARIALPVCFLFFLISYHIPDGYLGWHSLHFAFTLPECMYANYLTACFGFPPAWFVSADYFPILPWLFLFICGFFFYRLRPQASSFQPHIQPFSWLGRHSLIVYLLHQPLIYGLLYGIHYLYYLFL